MGRPAAGPALLVMSIASIAPPGASVGMHFLLAPSPRAVGEPLSWIACGLLSWGAGSRTLQQTMLPTRIELAELVASGSAPEAGEVGSGNSTVEWLLPGRLTASAVSADSVLLATGLDEGSVRLSRACLTRVSRASLHAYHMQLSRVSRVLRAFARR